METRLLCGDRRVANAAAFIVLALAWGTETASPATTDAKLRSSAYSGALRAMPLLQSSADTWFRQRPCASCHHQGLGMMAVSLARERGFPIHEELLARQPEKTFHQRFDRSESFVLGESSINEAIGQSYFLLGVAAAGMANREALALVTHMLAGKQHVTGKWSSYSRRPPLEDSEVTATALTLRALRLFPPPGRGAEVAARVDRAKRWLETAEPADGEERTMQILGLLWAGAGSEVVRPLAERLWSAQRADGGWAQIPLRESDAYATGQALVTLELAGVERAPDFARGVEYLLRTQGEDGSWLVTTRRGADPGLPYFETGFPHGKHQFISYAGSAWAAMALVLAAGEGTSEALLGAAAVEAPPRQDAEPTGVLPPLLTTALFGSVEDLASALAAGADANTATSKGLTALMCAVQDPRKVKALLTAGALPDARAKSGHSALLVAAGYDGAGESVGLLLDAGADVNASTTDGIIQPATALVRAVQRGDQQLATLLLDRGARVTGSDRQLPPLHIATWHGDVAMVAFLLDHGAPVDEREPTEDGSPGPTALMLAAADGLEPVARLLAARGADVNARDAEGRTPLMFASGAADRGSPAIVDLLLAGGADPRAAARGGETALAIAREHGRSAIQSALERAAPP